MMHFQSCVQRIVPVIVYRLNWVILLLLWLSVVDVRGVRGDAEPVSAPESTADAQATDPKTDDSKTDDSSAAHSGKIGVAVKLDQVVIAGSELEAKKLLRDDPLVVRVVETFPHGTDFRYDIECFALEAGTYNIADFLQRKDGSEVDVDPITLEVSDSLPAGQVKPSTLRPKNVAEGGRYRLLVVVAVVLWFLGLIFILTIGRKKGQGNAAEALQDLTFADRLRPLLESAQKGELDVTKKAELERTLMTYWQRRLGLESLSPHEAICELREHPQAGQLLVQLEQWLHRPESGTHVDVELLLRPYQEIEEPGDEANAAVAATSSEGQG
jgi:hypothetical protein